MKRWNVDLSFGVGVSASGIKAETAGDAIKIVKTLVENDVMIHATGAKIDVSDLEFMECTYVKEAKR